MQVMHLLPEHLAIDVLRAVLPTPDTPGCTFILSHLLHILPASLHGLVIQARCPSVTTDGFLALPVLPPPPCMRTSLIVAALRGSAIAGDVTRLALESPHEDTAVWAGELQALRSLRVLRVRSRSLGGLGGPVAALPSLQSLHLHGSFRCHSEVVSLLKQLREQGGVAELTLEVSDVTAAETAAAAQTPAQGILGSGTQVVPLPELLRRPVVAGKQALSRAARALSSSQRADRMLKAAAAQAGEALACPAPPRAAPLGLCDAAGGVPAALGHLLSLTRLSIRGVVAETGGQLASAVGQLTGLRDLHLRGLRFPARRQAEFDALAGAIGGLSQMTALCLHGFTVEDTAATLGSVASSSGSLPSAGVDGEVAGPTGWPSLEPALRRLERLQTLKLRHCNVCEEGVAGIAAAVAEAAPALHALEVCATVLRLDGVVDLLCALRRRDGGGGRPVRLLRIGSTAVPEATHSAEDGRRLVAALAPLVALTDLAFDSTGFAKAEAAAVLAQLSRLPALTQLHIVGCRLSVSEMAVHARGFPGLRRLFNFEGGGAGRMEGRWVEVWSRSGGAQPQHA